MTIGEVARRAGLQSSAIRYYERFGILPEPERKSGRRYYDEAVLDLLALVRFARRVSFSVREVRSLFGRGVEGERISKRWEELATKKIVALDHQIQQLRVAQEFLRRVLACRCIYPAECGRLLRKAATSALRTGDRKALTLR